MSERCPECGGRMRPRGRALVCRACGHKSVELSGETAGELGGHAADHPLRGIPNAADAPLFLTKDRSKIDAVLAWSREHPGEDVPELLLQATQADEAEVEAELLASLVRAGMLDANPGAVWTFYQTGRLVTAENFEMLPADAREEIVAAQRRWDAMSQAERQEFARKARSQAEA